MGKGIIYPLLFLLVVMFAYSQSLDCETDTYTSYGITDDIIEWVCQINTTNDYDCVSYIKDSVGGVVQVNPDYQKKTDSVIALFNKIEDRETFRTVNGLVSVYFTKENLLFDGTNYTYGVRCAYQGNTTRYEQSKIPRYEKINAPQTRIAWWSENQFGIVAGATIFVIILILIIILIIVVRREL